MLMRTVSGMAAGRGWVGALAAVSQFSSSSAWTATRRPLDMEEEEVPGRAGGQVQERSGLAEERWEGRVEHEGPAEKGINSVTLMGRVGGEPQIRGTEDKPITTFSLATNLAWQTQDGWTKRTDWHNVASISNLMASVE